MKANSVRVCLLAGLALLWAGCDYPAPLTTSPTRRIEERVLGDWLGVDQDAGALNLRRFDDSTYVAIINGEAYRIYHSDFADRPFVSVQDINSPERKYCFYVWRLSADGNQLVLQRLRDEVIPGNTSDTATLQELVRKNLGNPQLLGEELVFKRKTFH